MNTFLFLFSFTLIGLAFFFIILLFLKVSRIQEIEKKQAEIIKEIETVITTYVLEMKEENELFLRKLMDVEIRKDTSSHSEPIQPTVPQNTKSFTVNEQKLSDEDLKALLPNYEEAPKVESNQKEEVVPENLEEKKPQSIIDQIEQLQKQGATLDEIARTLEKGKTEIELLLKFR